MARVTEYVGRSGVVTSDLSHGRVRKPRPGDPVLFPDGSVGRVDAVGTGFCEPDEVHLCERTQSVFLLEPGSSRVPAVSIGGGPFRMVKQDSLEPTYDLRFVDFWNWGDRSPGADQGCQYRLARPLFKLKED